MAIISTLNVAAQDNATLLQTRKNAAVLQVGGTGVFYSVGYERVLFAKEKHAIVANINGTLYPKGNGVFGGLSYLYLIKTNAIEAGLNVGYLHVDDDDETIKGNMLTPQIGYRRYFKNEKLFLKAGMNLFLQNERSVMNELMGIKALPWPYVGVGFRF